MIREMRNEDGPQVLRIYRMGLETRMATFETRVPGWEEWQARYLPHSRFVFEGQDNAVWAWVALSAVSARAVYSGVAEVSIYVADEAKGKGIGYQLMQKLIESSEQHNIWTLTSSVFPENEATLRLHKKAGFRLLGRREKIARLDGIWRDTILLERRSPLEKFS